MARILIVEDDPHSARVLRCLIRSGTAHDVFVTLDADEVLRRCRAGEIDLGLFDVSLAGCVLDGNPIDGLGLCRLIKANAGDRRIPVILVTAHAMRGDAERLLRESGADDYVSKPVQDHDAMLRLVEEYLRNAAKAVASQWTECQTV